MPVLDTVLWGFAILAFSLVLVVSMRYIGLVPETKPPKRTYLFEDNTGERQNLFSERNQEMPPPTTRPSSQIDTYVLSSANGHTEPTDDTHRYVQPDIPPTTDEIICPHCGFHNLSAYSFCSECAARLTRQKH